MLGRIQTRRRRRRGMSKKLDDDIGGRTSWGIENYHEKPDYS
jgi:hypothetical protein